jgi:hypothetical protein
MNKQSTKPSSTIATIEAVHNYRGIIVNSLFKFRSLLKLSVILMMLFIVTFFYSVAAFSSTQLPFLPTILKRTDAASESIPTTLDLSSGAWLTKVEADIRQSEYQITWQDQTYLSDLSQAYQAPNRAHNLRTYFTSTGIRVIPRTEIEPSWEWALDLIGYGYAGQVQPIPVIEQAVSANRIEYYRGNSAASSDQTLVEWYINNEHGLKQGFTLQALPDGKEVVGKDKHHLVLEFAFSGNLIPISTNSGTAIEFTNLTGVRTLGYTDLYVYDATDRRLPAHFSLSRSRVAIEIDATKAIYPITVDPMVVSPDWVANGDNQTDANFGWSVGTAGDVNGDGFDDIIVGSPWYDGGQTDEGRVYIYYGSTMGLSAAADWIAESNQNSAHFGYSVNTAGDVNGDTYDDIIIGAELYDNGQSNEGGVFVYYGSATGLDANGTRPSGTPANADWTAESNQVGGSFGYSVSRAGDVNGDTYDDIIIGARWYDNGQLSEGGVFIYYGSATGLGPSGTPANADWTAEGNQIQASFGNSVNTAGDVNDDGFDDVIIGAHWYDNGQLDEGAAFVYYGSAAGLGPNGTPTNADWTTEGDQENALLGYSVSTAGDVNGDGFDDIIIGAYLYDNGQVNEGQVYIYYGSLDGLTSGSADWTAESNQDWAGFGQSVSTAGDVNGDGFDDVIIGAHWYDNGQFDEGGIFIYYGSPTGPGPSGTPANADWITGSDQGDAFLGYSVSMAGDIDGDGFEDVIVGAPYYDISQTDEGQAYIYLGDGLDLEILDPDGNPVTTVITNTDGWPTPNPLTATVTLRCPAGGLDCTTPLTVTINSPDNARFYVFNQIETNKPAGLPDLTCASSIITNSVASYRSYEATCSDLGSPDLSVPAGQTRELHWAVWIQPSQALTLTFSVDWSVNGTASQFVQIPEADIHPVVVIPGFIGTWPPEPGGDLDPLQNVYDNLVEALQLIGYELGVAGSGETLIPFGWDWRAPHGNTGRVTLAADIDSIRDVANRTKAYVDYDKVDIISHSAGGLVARAFIEDAMANNQDEVNRLITLGSPHRGVPAAYRGGRGGQYQALFPGNPQVASGIVAGLIACDQGFWAGLNAITTGQAEQIVLNEQLFYNFVQTNIPSTEDLLPISEVTPAYIVDNGNPAVVYPFGNPPGAPPANPFLEDMSTDGGDYDVSKLLVPNILSIYSDNHPQPTDGIYRVDPPPFGQGDNVRWGHGQVVLPPVAEPGDALIPAYSANLTQTVALSTALNITTTNAVNIFHLHLPSESGMVRRIIAYITGIDVIDNTTLWTKANPQPLVAVVAIELVTCSPIRTLLTDPLGRQAGLDPDTGAIINDIPGAIVTKDGDEPHLIIAPHIQGQYQVQAQGIDNGDYRLGAFEIFSGTTQITGRVFTGTIAVGQSRQFGFDTSNFQEENGQVVLEAEHFNWQIGEVNQAWITQTTQTGYVGSGYVNAWPDVDRLYTGIFTTTSPQLEYTINFTTTGTYYVWARGYAPNAAGDSVYISLDGQTPALLTGLPPRQWAWANRTLSGQEVTLEVTEPGEHTLFLWQREDGLKLDRIVLTVDDSYNPEGNGPAESPRTGDD